MVLIGAAGQLAHDLRLALSGHELIAVTRAELEISEGVDAIEGVLAPHRPEVLVNAAAYNLVDLAEREPEAAFAANAIGPRNLAIVADRLRAKLVHFSTDYVFGQDPARTVPWEETDPVGPISTYGLSKLTGEFAVAGYCNRHLILRTCGLFGIKGSRGKGGNFVETMLRLGESGQPVRVVADQRCTPSSTVDVAHATADLIARDATGLFHLTNAGSCTWHELAAEIFRLRRMRVELEAITTAQFGAVARRPAYSVLSLQKLEAQLGRPMPPWQDALARYLESRDIQAATAM